MARASTQQNAFNSGELSPLLLGRQDLAKYANGMATCFNAVTLVQGGWTRRGGSVFLFPPKFGGSKKCRIIEFVYNVSQSYILEFGENYIRFFTQGGILINTPQTIENITAANPGVVTITGHGYSNGDRLIISDGGGVTQLNDREVIVANATADTFEIQDIYGTNINTTGYDAYSTGGSLAEIFEVVTTYAEADLTSLNYEQSADVLYLFHTDFHTATLTRLGALSWALADISFIDGPYLSLNATATTMGLSGTTGSVTVTASSTTGINNDTGFQTTDVGRLIRWKDPAGNWTWLEITAWTSTTVVTATIQGPNASAATATVNWRMGLYSDTTGWPTTGHFHEDRLWLAGVELYPQRVDGSRTAIYDDFTPTEPDGTVVDDHAISFSLVSSKVNIIQWLQSDEKGMLVGTLGGEWVVRPSSLAEALTPTNVTAKPSTSYGSEFVKPVKAGSAVIYAQRTGRKIRELAYVFESDGFKSPDMTVLAEHITRPKVTRMAFQQQPQSILWMVRSDGVLLGFTYVREQDVLAWHRHTIAGVSDAQGSAVVVEDVAVIPSPDSTHDEVYIVCKRYINGQTERYIEVLGKIWETGDLQEEAFHVDCGTTVLLAPAANTISGLWYLEGETLGVWADGTVHPDVTVSNGKVTLDGNYSQIAIGYNYNSDGEVMPSDSGAQDGSSQGKKKSIKRVGFWLLETLGLKYGPSSDKLAEILVRRWGDNWGEATDLFTGVTRHRFEDTTNRIGTVFFRADTPAPATVLSLMTQVHTQDDS